MEMKLIFKTTQETFLLDEETRKFDLVLHDDIDNPVAWMNSKALTGFIRRSVEQMHG